MVGIRPRHGYPPSEPLAYSFINQTKMTSIHLAASIKYTNNKVGTRHVPFMGKGGIMWREQVCLHS